MKDYSFHSIWELDSSRAEAWQVLTAAPFSWSEWWPQLKEVRNQKPSQNLSGSSFSCVWQAVGYKIACDIVVAEVVDQQKIVLNFVSGSDLEGVATCNLHSTQAGRTTIEFDLVVKTTKAWMNSLEPVLKPLFVINHHHLMNSGRKGLQHYLKNKSLSKPRQVA